MTADDHTAGLVHVVAAAVTDAAGRVLIAQRPMGKQLAGSWEFPGGKLESGETRRQGLARELREELGIRIGQPRPLIRVRHAYPFGEVLIDMWVVRSYEGESQGLDGQRLRWCTQDELVTAELLPADRPIVAALRLPERLREGSTPYYTVSDFNSLRQRRAVGMDGAAEARLQGAYCATTVEAAGAADGGADFLVMRDVLAEGELASLCESVPVPVFALGIGLERAWALGASGCNEVRA